MLEEQGIQVARRTVAKYREALKIAPANLRDAVTRLALEARCAAIVPAVGRRGVGSRCSAHEVRSRCCRECSAAGRTHARRCRAARRRARVMRLNLESRLAQRVLSRWPRRATAARMICTRWRAASTGRDWITPRNTLRVDTTAQRAPLRSLNFAALRIKDAVCDVLREASGERPSVDTREPDLQLVLHLDAERATLYVDTSGEPLFKRGWREDKGDAPLKETLAAAMLAAAGWRGRAKRAARCTTRAAAPARSSSKPRRSPATSRPGLKRRFAFERLLPVRGAADARAVAAPASRAQRSACARARCRSSPATWPFAWPTSRAAMPSAPASRSDRVQRRRRARAACAELPPELPGTLMLNPPYGERIDVRGKARRPRARISPASEQRAGAPEDFFARLASHWKRAYTTTPPAGRRGC